MPAWVSMEGLGKAPLPILAQSALFMARVRLHLSSKHLENKVACAVQPIVVGL